MSEFREHAQVDKVLYSVPYRLIGTRLDARATAEMVEFYLDGELVKTHPFTPRGVATAAPLWKDHPVFTVAWRRTARMVKGDRYVGAAHAL